MNARPSAMTANIVCAIVLCVSMQLMLTVALPDQNWSMPAGMIGLCFIDAVTTRQLSIRSDCPDPFAANMVSGVFVGWMLMWIALVYEIHRRGSEQSLSCLMSFVRQILMILFLIPRNLQRKRSGERLPIVFDAILGVVLCGVLCTTLWPQIFTGRLAPPDMFQFCLGHSIFAVLAVGSYVVQRGSPPMFLKALAITQCIYSATSMLWIVFFVKLGWVDNSPLWVYGDTAFVLYPLIANYCMPTKHSEVSPLETKTAPNQALPFLIALFVLGLAFGSAQHQHLLAALIGVAGLLLFAFRVVYVTAQYRRTQDMLLIAARERVESMIDVVHELRSPLASVVLNASALARSDEIPSKLKARVDTIANRCGTVTRLLNDVLDLERIEAGLMEISIAPVDAVAVCRSAIDAVTTTAQTAGVALFGPVESAQRFQAEGDTGLLVRVIVNLLDNAVRFTPSGGSVSVLIGRGGPAQVAIVVEDTGIGLSPDARATLFRRFGHAGNPINGAKGSGLGLSISSSAVEAMNGCLSLTARTDSPGTRATITLQESPSIVTRVQADLHPMRFGLKRRHGRWRMPIPRSNSISCNS